VADTTLGFVELLDLEVIEANIFRGRSSPGEPMRVFGGQVAAQALIAAGRTVPSERRVHSLHAYFLRPGDSGAPIVYEVDRIRDGRSFTTRRVIAIQHGEVIFNLAASFQRAEEGLSHQASTMPDVPGPDETPTMAERLAPYAEVAHEFNGWFERSLAPRPIEVRYVEIPPTLVPRSGPQEPRQALWVRAVRPFPDDPLYHACAVTYASDLSLISTTLRPHGLASASAGIASLGTRRLRQDGDGPMSIGASVASGVTSSPDDEPNSSSTS